ncbi:hypothetical protein BBK36DRAFT_1125617 [Trichoderma citrinoviride]|uniref:Zn(2)-C6 fungal-type domain-containing protein n=1 Tax=Trichoderma citrinoviride TaxID=58853 RepID=A0A2T4B336_9HYPO|nr:hypothetical protein BBK36DRAFT_1125617 [Trichoderma citrinoviride]PTB63724.1 hypothetical protein BBK36DRAFT_1125617 [Trichoderma citrinoviride]
MFNTFKIDPETNSVQELRRASDPISARSSQHQACNNCHAKKLKCSGEKSGCERCIASQLRCEYTRSPSRRGGRKSSGRNSTDSRGGSELAGGDSSPSSQAGKSRHRSSKHLHAVASSSRSRASASRDEEYGDALDLFDPTTLGPDDGFDLRSLSLEASDGGYGSGTYYNQQQQQQQQQQHGQGSWQHMSSNDQYGNLSGSSYMGTSNSSGQDYDVDYYGHYDEYGQYHSHQNDPRYWGGQQQ